MPIYSIRSKYSDIELDTIFAQDEHEAVAFFADTLYALNTEEDGEEEMELGVEDDDIEPDMDGNWMKEVLEGRAL